MNAIPDDGRVDITLEAKTSLDHALPPYPQEDGKSQEFYSNLYPFLNIVIQIVGSRGKLLLTLVPNGMAHNLTLKLGDIQPFLALGKELQVAGHRVRIATHDVFKDFVKESGLRFFPIGGDPSELMAVSLILSVSSEPGYRT